MSFFKPVQEKLEKFYAIPIIGVIPSIFNIPVTIGRWIRAKTLSAKDLNDDNYSYVNPTEDTLDSIKEFEYEQSKSGLLYSIANILTLSFLGAYNFFQDLTKF